jgi:hypothetical protein
MSTCTEDKKQREKPLATSISGHQNEREREWARRRELQHAVLLYLLEGDPTKWDVLYDHFDQNRTGEIGPALRLAASQQSPRQVWSR